MNRLIHSVSAAALLFAAAPAFADQVAADADVAGRVGSSATAVDQLVVTATRSPVSAEKIGSTVTVLDEAYIEDSQRLVVVDLLQETPGVSFVRNGGPGTTTSVFIRGGESQHTVAIIDGVKLNDPSSTQGGFNFGNLLVGDVSRIEVLRGAQSTLWGSQAIGGVVNIVTREPSRPFEASADVEAGGDDTASVRAGVGGASERLIWRVAGNYFTTDGFSAFAAGKEADGYQNAGLSGRARLKITEDVSAEVRSVWSKGKNDFDAFNGDSAEFARTEELVVYTGLNVGLLDGRLNNRLAFAYTDTDRENQNPARPAQPLTFDAAGKNKRWEYQGVFAITDAFNAVFGAESENSRMRTRSPSATNASPPFVRGKSGIDSIYVQLQGEVAPGLTLTGGLRYDDHETYGDKTLGSAAVAWALNEGSTVLRASFGQGFRAPGLYELYSEYGNVALQPESFDAWDAGIEQKLFGGAATVSATYFHREADNEIRYNGCSSGTSDPMCFVGGVQRFGYYRNVLKTEAQGLEFAGKASLGERVTLNANYTWTNAENRSGAAAGKQAVRRPENQGFASATYLWPLGLSTTAAVRYVGKTYNNDANTQVLKSYTVVDFRAAYPVNETYEVFGRVENAFDENYQTVLNYGTPGRGAYLGLRARF
ncbi:TonB-dependent receptor plug domain-containing protein [Caulobacter sp. NIBR2454]|uniref:TonB-dependent receptor plug domain-containing protein n=1 Tax=Caulobacter sp. NIBR2454 TaxID=3015996 RepID=UPI0022B69DC0|nr:TonB-dependent receptor [Caulobacter sp. NIBR2454]